MKEIQLTQGKTALVDDEDFEYLNQWKWHCSKGYAARNVGMGHKIKMHNVVLQEKSGFTVDHINGNTADNRKSNLRYCTHAENMRNTKIRSDNKTGHKGVSMQAGKYRAVIWVNNNKYSLGMFAKLEEAARAYDDAAKRLHGDFVRTDF